MKLLLINQSKVRMPRAFLQTWVDNVARALRPQHKINQLELILVFVSRSEMRRMNFQYREKNYATDILSFNPAEPSSLGELVICPEVVARQSKQTGLSPRDELAFMVLHGILHLLGYDHEVSERAAKRMFKLQNEIFVKLQRSR